jgi:hypothetical protein
LNDILLITVALLKERVSTSQSNMPQNEHASVAGERDYRERFDFNSSSHFFHKTNSGNTHTKKTHMMTERLNATLSAESAIR